MDSYYHVEKSAVRKNSSWNKAKSSSLLELFRRIRVGGLPFKTRQQVKVIVEKVTIDKVGYEKSLN